MRRMKAFGPFLVLALLAGCLGPATRATPEQAERLTLALCRALRLQHDAALGGALAPTSQELQVAWDELRASLHGAGIAATKSADAVRAARDALLAHDVVFLPAAVPSGDLDLDFALARVTAREAGLEREVAGQVVRYRRVEHRGLLVPDLATYAAQRRGDARWPVPLARRSGVTVYVDRLAVERQAGRGTAAHLDADRLAAEAELRRVAELRFEDDVRFDTPARNTARRFGPSALLAAAVEGDARYHLAEIERLAARWPVAEALWSAGPADRALARALALEGALHGHDARQALDAVDPALPPAERARRALARVREGL